MECWAEGVAAVPCRAEWLEPAPAQRRRVVDHGAWSSRPRSCPKKRREVEVGSLGVPLGSGGELG